MPESFPPSTSRPAQAPRAQDPPAAPPQNQDTPTPPEGWAVRTLANGNFSYVTPILEGRRHELKSPRDLTKWISNGLIDPILRKQLVFSKTKFVKLSRNNAATGEIIYLANTTVSNPQESNKWDVKLLT